MYSFLESLKYSYPEALVDSFLESLEYSYLESMM
jgi:hypothetical protein